ncbi:bifunctional diguanylate cyclase/phosphodiesterase [Marinimicrobium locisalis]|uniref:bifunctional diguanylate cyclase/phosphodiesterase n=1 Tax=Marinimicrobium locisalis TaxID=546022 RepID=UPI00322214A9
MPWIKSINTKLLMIVVLFAAISGVLIGAWQGAKESQRLQQHYNDRLQALGERYRDQLAGEMVARQGLLTAARDAIADALARNADTPVPLNFGFQRDPDGAVRAYRGASGVFIHRDTAIDAELRRRVYHTSDVWLNIEPLLKSQFSAFYFITEDRVSRIWPASLVSAHKPDHDVTEEIFYTLAEPAHNPERKPRWTPLYFDAYSQTWTMSLLVPMYIGQEFIGVVGADLRAALLFSQLNQVEDDFKSLEGFIFSREGELIVHSAQSERLPSEAEQPPQKTFNPRDETDAGMRGFIDAVLAEAVAPGAVQVRSLREQTQHVSYQPLPQLGWYVGLHYSHKVLEDEYAATMKVIYQNLIGMLLFLAVGLYYGLKWVVTRRVQALASMTERVGADNWDLRVPESGKDEISQLARGINRMLEKINELIRGLNHNIQDMERLAYYDQLTGLENRFLFKAQLRTALSTTTRDRQQLALLYLDLDHFKDINDSLGHEAGDQLLVEVAHRLRGCLREEDSVARLGGDEFAVLLRHVKEARYASLVAEKIIDALRRPIRLSAQEVVVGASIGITLAPDDSSDIEILMRNADLAMYQAKNHGRNIHRFYTPELNTQVEQRLRMERELRQAVANREFELFYQPQLDMATQQVVGIEALIRWRHPYLGLVPPDEFIPAAEESGMIIPIGKWVLHAACQQAKSLQKAGFKDIKVSINVSARQLNDLAFVNDLKSVIAEIGVDPHRLVLEVTESTLMADAQLALKHLHAVREIGVGLAIDDFGTGYSSLSYLKRLPVNWLKIDRSFVQQLPDDEEDQAITTLIVAMAKSLKYKVVVEGVETEPQLGFLQQCGCHYGQGFYFSRPVPVEQLMLLLFEKRSQAPK